MSAIDDLPPLREVIRQHGLSARKSLGQNFLFDLNLTAKIARAAAPLDDVVIVEIGPGPGGLTRALLAAGARRVIAIEHDPRALPALEEISRHYPGRLDVVCADAQTFDPRPLLRGERAKIVANLPYNIATALLVGWLSIEPWPPWYEMMVLMFQREVADRLTALPGTRAYGPLSILCGRAYRIERLFDLPPGAFRPSPKVVSSVTLWAPRGDGSLDDALVAPLRLVLGAAFAHRRQTIQKNLRVALPGGDVAARTLLETTALDGRLRAEMIPPEGFVALARAWPH